MGKLQIGDRKRVEWEEKENNFYSFELTLEIVTFASFDAVLLVIGFISMHCKHEIFTAE